MSEPTLHLTARLGAVINTMKQKLERRGEEAKTAHKSQLTDRLCRLPRFLNSAAQLNKKSQPLPSSPTLEDVPFDLKNLSLSQESQPCFLMPGGLGFLLAAQRGLTSRPG